ncbi:MAG: radical SAM protein, partial [Nitrosopumilus sp.]
MTEQKIHTLHYNLTNTCNLKCSFCYINAVQKPTHELPLSMIESLANDFHDLGGQKVILSGGEPLVRKDWYDVFKIWDDLGIRLSVVSNGTQIPKPNVISKLKNFSNIIFLI